MTKIKTEHAGAKNGGGHFGKREEAKRLSNSKRRHQDKTEASHDDSADRLLTEERTS